MNTNITKTWTIVISEDEIFARCTNETLYQAYNRSESNPKGDALVIQDDDFAQFDVYFGNAVANLQILLAKRMSSAPINVIQSGHRHLEFTLDMHDNHDDNILPVLEQHCKEYVIKQVLEQWYHIDFGSTFERLEINHCIHYRKNPVRRRVGPLF
jgi:hypothetical protein